MNIIDKIRNKVIVSVQALSHEPLYDEKCMVAMMKSAVKGGDRLSVIEIKDLLSELSECSNPYSCPHGRPTFIRITRYDAERAFKRK